MLTYAAHSVDKIEFNPSEPIARGIWISKFERALENAVGANHAVAVNSGTTAIYLAIRALGLTGKRIAVPSITFCGTANAAICAGATPVYANVGLDGNISINWLAFNSDKWDAALPVHYAGNLCDMQSIRALAGSRPIVVDACHALGADGLMKDADAVCFSFHPAKQVTTGEGGAVLTNDPAVKFRLQTLRHNGIGSVYDEKSGIRQNVWLAPSLNYWMSDINAKIGCEQMEELQDRRAWRAALSWKYYDNLPSWCNPVVPERLTSQCAWCMFSVLLENPPLERYALMRWLLTRGIETQILYQPLHLQPMGGGNAGDLPGAEDFGARVLALPLHNKMNEGDVMRVCDALKELHG